MQAPAAHDWLLTLRAETRDWHTRLELRVDLPRRLASRAGYTGLLAAFLGFYDPLEPALAAVALDPAFELPARRKAALLHRDLAALGVAADRVPRCRDLPALASVPQALGALYVMEGATLGGQLIGRQIAVTLGAQAEGAAAFFASYGSRTGAMWGNFRQQLAQSASTSSAQRQVIDNAAATFAALDRWVAKCDAVSSAALYNL